LIALSVSLTAINKAFPGQTYQSSWVAAVISLAQCVLSLFIGEMSNIFRRRYFIIAGNFFLLVGGLVSSRANSVGIIIGGQTLTGISVAVGYLATPLFSEIVPKRSRGIVVAIRTAGLGTESSWGAIGIRAFQKYNVGGLHQG
jgi:MFS family permease